MLDCDREYAPIEYENGVTLVDRFARYLPEDNVVQTVTGWEVADEQTSAGIQYFSADHYAGMADEKARRQTSL